MKNRHELGIGSILNIKSCEYCSEEYYIGYWDRTDGNGQYCSQEEEYISSLEHVCKEDANDE